MIPVRRPCGRLTLQLRGIVETINSTVRNYDKNNNPHKFWKKPLVSVIPANDERLKTLKEAVSAEHLSPYDILPDAESIISFFIPYQEHIVKSNIEGDMASEEWVIAYIKTNDLITSINDEIEKLMQKYGYKTGKLPATHNFDDKKLMSNWSHRHIAYIAGLGTFGINNMLITKNGCCGRFGTTIINYKLDEYDKTGAIGATGAIKEKCLNKQNGSCGACRKKCVFNAYENNAYNRHKCYEQCLKNRAYHKGLGAAVCGKCLVGLPCSVKEP